MRTIDHTVWPYRLQHAADVMAWFKQLLGQGFNFHPDDSGASAVWVDNGAPCLTPQGVEAYERLMQQARGLCADVCEVACDAFAAHISAETAQAN